MQIKVRAKCGLCDEMFTIYAENEIAANSILIGAELGNARCLDCSDLEFGLLIDSEVKNKNKE